MQRLSLRIRPMAKRFSQASKKRRRMRRSLFAYCLVLLVAITGCAFGAPDRQDETGEVVVFAAASLTEAFGDLAHQFESEHPGAEVVLNLAGSQQLAHQLSQGAPADVLASADEEQMAAAIQADRVKPGSQQIFAYNELALIFPANNPAGLRTLSDLARPGLQLIMAAPEVPAGRYAAQFLDAAGADPGYGPIFRERVMDNVVSYEENVRAVLSKVRLGEADAGIVYRSDLTDEAAQDVGQLAIPEQLNVQAAYTIAPLEDSQNADLAETFIQFVLSDQGQAKLEANGLKPIAAGQ